MSDTVAAARLASNVGGAQRSAPASSAGRLTRADSASRVAAFESSFDAVAAANSVASGILAASNAGTPVDPIAPAPPVNGRGNAPRAPSDDTGDEQTEPNGRGLLSGSIPILLAETRSEEISVLAADPGLADRNRAAQQYRDVAARIQASRSAAVG